VVTPRWPRGRPRRALALTLEPGLGEISPPRLVGATYEADWRLPAAFGGARAARLRVADRVSSLRATAELPLKLGAPVRLQASVPAGLPADGRSAAWIEALPVDSGGNSTPGDRFRLRYVAPRLREPRGWPGRGATTDAFRLTDPHTGLTTQLAIPLRTGPRRWEVGVRVGYLTNFGYLNAGLVEADVRVRSPFAGEQLFLGLDAGFYGGQTSAPSLDGERVDVSVRAVPLRLRAGWEPPVRWVRPYVAVAGGGLWFEVQLSSPRLGVAISRGWAWMVSAAAGVAVRAGPGSLGVELAYGYAPIDEGGVSGNLAGLSATARYGVDFE
jgi:hypothetical protein